MKNIFKFKSRKAKKGKKIKVSFHIDRETDRLLSLACFSEGLCKSEFLRITLDKWFAREGGKSFLIKAVANSAFEVFQYRNKYEGDVSEGEFGTRLKIELESGVRSTVIPKTSVDKIMDKFYAKVKRANEKKNNKF